MANHMYSNEYKHSASKHLERNLNYFIVSGYKANTISVTSHR